MLASSLPPGNMLSTMLMQAVETAAQSPDAWAIVLSLVTGAVGGLAGALIASGTQRTLAKRTERREAAKALWNFHRVLHDFALEAEANELRDGTPQITKTEAEDIAAARGAAYVYRSNLPASAAKLLSRQWLPAWIPSTGMMGVAEDMSQWAKDLESVLIQTFGKQHS
jgi:hypothetical protein